MYAAPAASELANALSAERRPSCGCFRPDRYERPALSVSKIAMTAREIRRRSQCPASSLRVRCKPGQLRAVQNMAGPDFVKRRRRGEIDALGPFQETSARTTSSLSNVSRETDQPPPAMPQETVGRHAAPFRSSLSKCRTCATMMANAAGVMPSIRCASAIERGRRSRIFCLSSLDSPGTSRNRAVRDMSVLPPGAAAPTSVRWRSR